MKNILIFTSAAYLDSPQGELNILTSCRTKFIQNLIVTNSPFNLNHVSTASRSKMIQTDGLLRETPRPPGNTHKKETSSSHWIMEQEDIFQFLKANGVDTEKRYDISEIHSLVLSYLGSSSLTEFIKAQPKELKKTQKEMNLLYDLYIGANTLSEFLFRQQLEKGVSDRKLESLKQVHRYSYLRRYSRENKAKRVNITLTKKEYDRLSKESKRVRKKPTAYIKELALAYLDQEYILEQDDQLEKLQYSLLKIGNNLNQLVTKVNRTRVVERSQVLNVVDLFKVVKAQVDSALRSPQELERYVLDRVEADPQFREKVNSIIKQNV